jgi:hypothetical protein
MWLRGTSHSLWPYGDDERMAPGDITRSIIICKNIYTGEACAMLTASSETNTPLRLSGEQTTVVPCKVRCSGYVQEHRANDLEETDVTFDFTNKQGNPYCTGCFSGGVD